MNEILSELWFDGALETIGIVAFRKSENTWSAKISSVLDEKNSNLVVRWGITLPAQLAQVIFPKIVGDYSEG